MKLLKFKLNSDFRSLHTGFAVDFLTDIDKSWEISPYCLVGRNGSGKSNILEALAAIFYHVECMHLVTKPDGFEKTENSEGKGFDRNISYPDAYILEYLYYLGDNFSRKDLVNSNLATGFDAHIKIEKEARKAPKIFWINNPNISARNEALTGTQVKTILPEYIVAYSSGENEILSLPFFKMRFIQYDEYVKRLTKDLDYIKPESRFVFLDEHFNQAILLSLYLIHGRSNEKNEVDREKDGPDVLSAFESEIELLGIQSFRVIIKQHHYLNVHSDVLQTLTEKDKKDKAKTTRELTSKISDAIDKLMRCSTINYFDEESKDLFLDYFVDDELRKAFQRVFGDALSLFQTFQILLNLNFYQVKDELKNKVYHSKNIFLNKDVIPVPYDEDKIFRFKDLVLKKKNVESTIYTKSLSDGEFQLIHSIGLCILFRDTNSLFLLDEPETHFNPDWRSKFISTLRSCLNQENTRKENRRELLITSHSPYLVSDTPQGNVLVFDKDGREVHCARPNFNTLGASINKITMEIFKARITIGSYAISKLKEIEERFKNGENSQKLLDELENEIGESVERLFLQRKIEG